MTATQQRPGVTRFGDAPDTFNYVPVARAGYDWTLQHTTPAGVYNVAVQYYELTQRLVLVGVKSLEDAPEEATAPNTLDDLLVGENTLPATLKKLTPELTASITRAVRKVSPFIGVSVHYLGDSLTRR